MGRCHAAGMKHVAVIAILLAITSAADARSGVPHCTFDRVTVGVTPCGADKPNAPPSNNPRPPGDPVYWSNGVQAPGCSYVPITVRFPGGAPQTGKAVKCVD